MYGTALYLIAIDYGTTFTGVAWGLNDLSKSCSVFSSWDCRFDLDQDGTRPPNLDKDGRDPQALLGLSRDDMLMCSTTFKVLYSHTLHRLDDSRDVFLTRTIDIGGPDTGLIPQKAIDEGLEWLDRAYINPNEFLDLREEGKTDLSSDINDEIDQNLPFLRTWSTSTRPPGSPIVAPASQPSSSSTTSTTRPVACWSSTAIMLFISTQIILGISLWSLWWYVTLLDCLDSLVLESDHLSWTTSVRPQLTYFCLFTTLIRAMIPSVTVSTIALVFLTFVHLKWNQSYMIASRKEIANVPRNQRYLLAIQQRPQSIRSSLSVVSQVNFIKTIYWWICCLARIVLNPIKSVVHYIVYSKRQTTEKISDCDAVRNGLVRPKRVLQLLARSTKASGTDDFGKSWGFRSRDLPDITLQSPVYKASLGMVIMPPVTSLKAVIAKYEMTGGTSSIFFNHNDKELQRENLKDFQDDSLCSQGDALEDPFEASSLTPKNDNELDDQAHQQRSSKSTSAFQHMVIPAFVKSNFLSDCYSRALKRSISATILKGMSVRI